MPPMKPPKRVMAHWECTGLRGGKRVRPKAMTVAVILAGLIPIMLSSGTGAEVIQRIAAPMIGGMITAPLLSMFVIPAAYLLFQRRRLAKRNSN